MAGSADFVATTPKANNPELDGHLVLPANMLVEHGPLPVSPVAGSANLAVTTPKANIPASDSHLAPSANLLVEHGPSPVADSVESVTTTTRADKPSTDGLATFATQHTISTHASDGHLAPPVNMLVEHRPSPVANIVESVATTTKADKPSTDDIATFITQSAVSTRASEGVKHGPTPVHATSTVIGKRSERDEIEDPKIHGISTYKKQKKKSAPNSNRRVTSGTGGEITSNTPADSGFENRRPVQ